MNQFELKRCMNARNTHLWSYSGQEYQNDQVSKEKTMGSF